MPTVPTTQNAAPAAEPVPDPKLLDTPKKMTSDEPDEVEKYLKGRVEAAKRVNRQLTPERKRNVDTRLGRVASVSSSDTDGEDLQSEINPDWALTKAKTANLYSQLPQVLGAHVNEQYAPAIGPLLKAINYELGESRTNFDAAMQEVLNDVVNAAGIGAIIVGYAARFEDVETPEEDSIPHPDGSGSVQTSAFSPEALSKLAGAGVVTMKTVPRTVSDRFFATRISPGDLLTPAEFVGSCFDDGDWIGRRGRMMWGEAKGELRLTDDLKDQVLGGPDGRSEDDLRSTPDSAAIAEAKLVEFEEIFYWRYRFDPKETSYAAIWRLVWVKGLDKPVIHEAWKGQQQDPKTKKYVGVTIFPIQVLTLTYISDNPIPPSDTAAGRPQVNDMRRSRAQMFQNRERSVPLRWFDVNRVDPLIRDNLMKGTWQGMIPTNGDGSRTVGEIARASYPAEDMAFDQSVKADLLEQWQLTPDQAGVAPTGPRKNTAQIQTQAQSFATRMGQERGQAAKFLLRCCRVLGGLMALLSEFPMLTDQEKQAMQQAWDNKHVLIDLVLKIRPDSTITLDTQAQINRLSQFLNLTMKSGFVNPEPIIREMAELSGLDPATVVIKPQPKGPDEPNISFRFTGKDDLMNPVVVAMLLLHKQAPTPELLEQAKQLLSKAQEPPAPAPPPGANAPGGPAGAPAPQPPGAGAPAGLSAAHLPPADAHPQAALASKIAKRSHDMGGQ